MGGNIDDKILSSFLKKMEDYIPVYPSSDDVDIQRIVTSKREFNELAPTPEDRVDSKVRRLLNHQVLFERLMTLTDRMINIFEPGAGKTCAFIGFSEKYKDTGAYKKTIIIQKSNTLINETKKQILNNCTPSGEYIFEETFDDMDTTERMRKKRRNDSLKRWYEFTTYETFANQLEDLTDEQISQKYSKNIFIFDEAHNISPSDSSKQYKQFKRLCHNVKQSKICLVTATPMINDASESIYLMNLLLPADTQIPIKSEYRLSELEPYFRGKISFIKNVLENVKTTYMGPEFIFSKEVLDLHPTNPKLDSKEKKKIEVPINMYLTQLGDLQKEQYILEQESDKENFRSSDKGISSMVYPIIDGKTTTFSDYVEESGGKLKWKNNPNFLNWKHRGNAISFQEWLKDINNLRRISGKTAEIVEIETQNKGCSFIYQDIVDGPGAKMLLMIFTLYGFEQFTENSSEFIFTNAAKSKIRDSYPKRPRVALITGGAYGTDNRQDAILSLQQSEANVNGEYIQILIGSRKARDGINVFHALRMHLFTPYWHYSGMVQSTNRVRRLAGHNALKAHRKREALELGYREGTSEYEKYIDLELKVYRHCIDYHLDANIRGLSDDNSDYYFMKLAIEKEIPITHRMNMIKACAMDAIINRPRNKLDLDDPFNLDKILYLPSWTEIVDPTYIPYVSDPIDYSTYNVLYINPEKIVSKIKKILLKSGYLSYDDIKEYFKSSTKEEIYTAIESFRTQGKYVENEFGEKLTLEIGENGLHLQRFSYPSDPRFIHDISIYDFPQAIVIPRTLGSYFEKNAHQMARKTFLDLEQLRYEDFETKLEYIKKLSRWMQIQILEELIKTKYGESNFFEESSTLFVDEYISIFKGYIFNFTSEDPPMWVHVMTTTIEQEKFYNVPARHRDPKRIKIFNPLEKSLGWRIPFDEENNLYRKMIKEKIETEMSKFDKFKIYGTILQDGKFRLIEDGSYENDTLPPESVEVDPDEVKDRRMNQRGKGPNSIKKKILIKIAVAEKIFPTKKRTINLQDENIKYKREAIKAEHSQKYVDSLTDEEVILYHLWDSSNVTKIFQTEIVKKMRDDGRLYEPYILNY